MKSERILDHIYAIQGDKGDWIVYAPLSGMALVCDISDLEVLKRVLRGETTNREMDAVASELKTLEIAIDESISTPAEFSKLSILSNYKCNLSCSYCYSAKGRSNKEISSLHLHAALRFFLENGVAGKRKSLFFSGGGEPLLSWKVLRPALEWAIDEAKRMEVELQIHFMTNGTIYTDEIADFCKSHQISLCFSYEILDALQDLLRGRSQLVAENLTRYVRHGNIVYISSTITPQSVTQLEEMVEMVAKRFPGIGTITMEPATGADLYKTPDLLARFYDDFDMHFQRAYELARSLGIQLNTSVQHITDHYVDRYCPGKFCLTPNGTFTICHCASSPLEERYEKCTYGAIDDQGNIHFDLEKFRDLISLNHTRYPECKDCFARVHCGGECMTRRDTYPSEFMAEVCNHTRKMVFKEILKQLQDE